MKRFCLDTSVLIYDVDALFKFDDNMVIIPSVVLEEINRLKGEHSERGYYARQVASVLEMLSLKGPLKDGVQVGNTIIKTSYELHNESIRDCLVYDEIDYRIICCAKNNDAILVSRDRMMRVIARDFVEVQEYQADQLRVDEFYKGYEKLYVHESVIDKLYSKRLSNDFGLYPNQFVIFINESYPDHVGIGIAKGDYIKPCHFDSMNVNGLRLRTKPANLEQKMLMYLLHDPDVLCVSLKGPSGKGKSLLPIDLALASVYANFYNQLLYTKSVVAVDHNEELGFYKGDPLEKLIPHIQPLLSSIEFLYEDELFRSDKRKSAEDKVRELIEKGLLNVFPLANIRGKSINDHFTILDEAQNTTQHMMKTMITRMTDNSKMIVIGDDEQIDNRNLNRRNTGLNHLIEAGKEEDYIAHLTLDLVESSRRGKLATFGSKKL